MPRPTTLHYLLLPLAMLLMLCVYLYECSRTREMRDSVGPVACDPLVEMARQIRDSAWRNPMQPRKPDMPGGLQ